MPNRGTANTEGSEEPFKAYIVWLVFGGKVEDALQLLSKHYKVSVPRLKVGLPSRHKIKASGCYTPKDRTIYLRNSDTIMDPFVILHEFYHHLRISIDEKHKGTEKYADQFAIEFLEAYRSLAAKVSKNPAKTP
jgi:hypothetical protein